VSSSGPGEGDALGNSGPRCRVPEPSDQLLQGLPRVSGTSARARAMKTHGVGRGMTATEGTKGEGDPLVGSLQDPRPPQITM
jgi:hypothetical protein